ncbi:MAG TPA: DNA repair protein RadA [Candidatus Acidoferrales bacterium]|nr:DNA repair protein RadA [Candidatus Acidoferrales bacterium]
MSKSKSAFVCSACGAMASKWAGQCADCGAWNTLVETIGPAVSAGRTGYAGQLSAVRLLTEVEGAQEPRTPTGVGEMDRVLGGGLVPGAVILIGGDPGIGKSTLLLQLAVGLQARLPALYVAGEESLQQIALRARRLGLPEVPLALVSETAVERIIACAQARRPGLMVIDSIQTMYTEQLPGAPGSVGQVRESAAQLVRYAKQSGVIVVLIGHVTKEGALAGPRVLEHMVDTVLSFESDPGGRYRMLRAVKNRYGAVNELGVFAMTDTGLKEVAHPSAIFLSRHEQSAAGSVVTCIREGSRPLLLEIQALADDSPLANPRRLTVGLEHNRLALLLAILHRHGSVALFNQDVFLNVVGGIRVSETAADLPVAAAVVSSLRNRPIDQHTILFGELGLSGEVRPVPYGEERLREAAKHGFTRALVPQANVPRRGAAIAGMAVEGVGTLANLLDALA